MSESTVLLRFKTQGLKLAEKAAGRIEALAKRAKESAEQAGRTQGTGATPPPDARLARQERLNQRARRGRRERFGGRKGPGFGGVNFGEADETLLQFAEGNASARVAGLGTRGLGQIAGFALGGAAGALVVQATQTLVEEFVRPFVRNALEALERETLAPIQARLDEIERDDFQRRLKEDPDLQRRIADAEIARAGVVSNDKRWARSPGPLGKVD